MMKTNKLINSIKGIFILPKKKFYLGKIKFGTPYFFPRNFCSTIVKIRKLKLTPKEQLDKMDNDILRKDKKFLNLPMVQRNKNWIIKLFKFYFYIEIGFPISIGRNELGWKDKFNSPRYEWSPTFFIYLFKYQFIIWWNSPDGNNDKYYEMVLWYLNYSNKDIQIAEETWPWTNLKTKESSWNKDYLIKKK